MKRGTAFSPRRHASSPADRGRTHTFKCIHACYSSTISHHTTMAVPVAMVRSPSHESGTLHTVIMSGDHRFDRRRSATFHTVGPSSGPRHVGRQSLPVWTPTLPLPVYLQLITASWSSIAERRRVGFVARQEQATQEAPHGKCGLPARSPLS